MKIKTSELTGAALDYAVAQCEGREYPDNAHRYLGKAYYCPSTDWAFGGPIIDRESISTTKHADQNYWWAGAWDARHKGTGPTPLIAAMRCYVATKLGEEVEIPEELLK